MNLTVAMKIMGGFAIIAVLLVITSAISLWNLNIIKGSTVQQSELAIPTLKGSNKLANTLTQIGNLTLRAYYQTELTPLNSNLTAYNQDKDDFSTELKKLKQVVRNENSLLTNLGQVDSVYADLEKEIGLVFSNRQASINQALILREKIANLEEKADDAATMLLDLADHDLADTKLQRAVSLGESIETLLNGLVSSALEYRGLIDRSSTDLVGNQISNSFVDVNKSFTDIISELSNQGAEDVADDLSVALSELTELINSNNDIFSHKDKQLIALKVATENLDAAERDIKKANAIL
ncbi:methyl-accepting chemotaxis protein, partial [Colwellia sp. BRX8-8]|nr:methyl-accepting chemotaxis protein [Colwellia sp. BRX8-8]